mgnify:CR=1 FL=1
MMHWIKSFRNKSLLKIKIFFHWIRSTLSKAKLAHTPKSNAEERKIVQPTQLESATAKLSSGEKNYFVEARSWADDMYTSAIISRNRYKLAFFAMMGLACLLTIAIDGLIPMQHMEPLLVNHYQDGRVTVQPVKQPYAPSNQAQVESEIVRYVVNRESYDPSSYNEQYSLINLMSNNEVAKQYIHDQSTANKRAPINILANKGYRTVHVDSVIFLDSIFHNQGEVKSKQTHHNLAQVNFTITDHFKNSAYKQAKALTVLMSWEYQGMPNNPEDRWRDWDGFTVTHYTITQRNV